MHQYPNIVSASRGLLGESVNVVRDTGLEFAVVGGWSPFLLNGTGPILHPGTKDVDILFRDGVNAWSLRTVVESFRRAGYRMSAKHEFQVFRILNVAGEDFVFNVDILHASQGAIDPPLFVDHLELPIRASDFSDEHWTARSIAMHASEIIFLGHTVNTPVEVWMPDGQRDTVEVPVMDEVGTLVTKARSMSQKKRPRDAFDVFLAIRQARNKDHLVEGLANVDRRAMHAPSERERDAWMRASVELRELHSLPTRKELRTNIERYWRDASEQGHWDAAVHEIQQVLAMGGVQRPRR